MKMNLKTGGASASNLPSTATRRADLSANLHRNGGRVRPTKKGSLSRADLSANRLRQSKREIAKRVTELADQATR